MIPGAVIIGGSFQGLGALKSLSEKGISVCLLDSELNIGRFSRYGKNFFKCPDVKDEEALLQFLKTLAETHHLEGWVIFPTDDETVFFLSKNKRILESYFRITTPYWDITRYAYNKKYTYQLAQNIGIAIPKTYFPNSLDDFSKFNLSFPFIIKPAIVKTFYNKTRRKVYFVNNYKELTRFYHKTCQIIPTDQILFQEYIPGGTEHQYSFCPMFKDGQVLSRVIARRLRQHPMDFGHASTFVETVNIPQLEEIGVKFLRSMNYYGIAEIEFKFDERDQEYKMLEVNPRIWGWHTISRKSGVSLTYCLFEDMIGNLIVNEGFEEGVKWLRLTTDIATSLSEIFKRNMGWQEYFSSLRGKKEYAVFSFSDPLPMIVELLLLPYFWSKKGF